MSIRINTDLEYLILRLNIPPSRMEEYEDKTIEEILEAEAAAGNQVAIKMAADMFTDVNTLIELFQLADPENKLAILSAMTSSQLEKLVPMLEKKDLIEGLNFFTQASLLDMLKDIPKEELLKTVFQLFSESQVIEYMPEKELDRLLTGTDMDKEKLLEALKYIPEMYLQQIIESITGEEAQGGSGDLVRQIASFGDLDYKNAIINLQPTQKRQLTFILTNQENKLYEKFDTDAYTHMINRERDKDETIKGMRVIKPEYLEKMMKELPQDLLAVVITQIDTEKFADALINKFPELLAQLVAS
jgi:Mg/Co/Ni transporter MgtE